MSNFFIRTITGILFVVVIVGSIIWNRYIFASLFLIITILALLEFYKLIETKDIHPRKFVGISIGSFLFLSFVLVSSGISHINILYINIPLIFTVFIVELFHKSKRPFINIGLTLLGIIYIALPFSLLNFFYNTNFIAGKFHPHILLGFFIIIWTNDTSAYLVGSKFGKHRLFKRVSPNKSLEGSIGGAVFSLTSAYLISLFFFEFNLIQWIIIALIIVVFGTLGDLIESSLKRSLKLKDSGNILPGHGGILDRFDGVLLAAPFVFLYIFLII